MQSFSNSLRVAIQADHFEMLDLSSDTTYALALAAQDLGYQLWHFPPDHIVYRDSSLFAEARALVLDPGGAPPFSYTESKNLDLANDVDILLMRQDPPFDMHYISITHLLDTITNRVLILNNPTAVRQAPEKLSILGFADLLPRTGIAFSPGEIDGLCRSIGDCIVKPLFGNGGESIVRLQKDDFNRRSILEILERAYTRQPLMIQEYLPSVREGDRRIILIDGEPGGALDRIPPKDDNRANLHVGAQAILADLSQADKEICRRLGPWLREQGLFFCGIDVIGGKLTEINVTSPTGIVEIKALGGPDIAKLFWSAAKKKLGQFHSPI